MNRRWGGALKILLGLAAFVAVVVALVQTWDESRDLGFPPWERLLGAAALIGVGLVCGAQGWLYLLQRRGSTRLAATFYLSQIGKYLPGALWQPAGQLTMAVAAGVPAPVAATAVPVYMLTLIAAGGTVGAALALTGTDLPGAARLLPLLGILPIALLRREWMARSLDRLHRWKDGIPPGDVVPTQDAILAAYAWGFGVMLTTGLAFYLLGSWFGPNIEPSTAIPGFALAWTIGFLALPIPAGLGVREAILVGVLGAGVLPGTVLAASLVYRLVSIIVEVIAVVVTRLRTRTRPPV